MSVRRVADSVARPPRKTLRQVLDAGARLTGPGIDLSWLSDYDPSKLQPRTYTEDDEARERYMRLSAEKQASVELYIRQDLSSIVRAASALKVPNVDTTTPANAAEASRAPHRMSDNLGRALSARSRRAASALSGKRSPLSSANSTRNLQQACPVDASTVRQTSVRTGRCSRTTGNDDSSRKRSSSRSYSTG